MRNDTEEASRSRWIFRACGAKLLIEHNAAPDPTTVISKLAIAAHLLTPKSVRTQPAAVRVVPEA
jgi:hypothetical protein